MDFKGPSYVLVLLTDCPGQCRFQVYKRCNENEWRLLFFTALGTYGFERDYDYHWQVEKESSLITKADSQELNRSSSYSKGELYNMLEYGKYIPQSPPNMYTGAWRTRIVSRDIDEMLLAIASPNMNLAIGRI